MGVSFSIRMASPPLWGELEGAALGDCLRCMCVLTEALIWIQLVAEGSSSTWRAFGVAMAKARKNNGEGSAVQ